MKSKYFSKYIVFVVIIISCISFLSIKLVNTKNNPRIYIKSTNKSDIPNTDKPSFDGGSHVTIKSNDAFKVKPLPLPDPNALIFVDPLSTIQVINPCDTDAGTEP